jgi:hypothetical protein
MPHEWIEQGLDQIALDLFCLTLDGLPKASAAASAAGTATESDRWGLRRSGMPPSETHQHE